MVVHVRLLASEGRYVRALSLAKFVLGMQLSQYLRPNGLCLLFIEDTQDR